MKTINAYEFHELSEKVKLKVLDKYRDINTDYDWYEFVIDDWKEKLEEIGFDNATISFSGFGSQGDGCSFTADIDLDKFLVGEFEPLKNEDTCFEFVSNNHGLRFILYHFRQNNHLSSEQMDTLSDKFVNLVNQDHHDLSSEIYRDLESQYDYLTSNIAVQETIESNQYHFLEDGTMV
jgi:hypothetical protein